MAAVDVIDTYLQGLPGGARRLAHAEWGLTVEADGIGEWPLDLGVRVADELVRVQAFAVPADPAIDPGLLLHWNRQTRLIRFGVTRAGDVWVHGDAPVSGLDERGLDRLLGLVVQGAARVREYLDAVRRPAPSPSPGGGGWAALG